MRYVTGCIFRKYVEFAAERLEREMISQIIIMTIAYVLGLISVLKLDFGFAVLFSASLLFICAVGAAFNRHFRAKTVTAFALLAGVILMSCAWHIDMPELSGLVGRYAEVEGIITDCIGEYDGYNSYEFEIDKLRYLENETEVSAPIRVTSDMAFAVGNKVALRGFISEISAPYNRTEFDFRTYYKTKGIIYRMHAEEAEIIKAKAMKFSPSFIGNYIKNRIGFAIERFYSGDDAALLKAVLTGNRSGFSKKLKNTLLKTSADRFLRPSYMHLYLLISLCEFAFAFVQRKRRGVILALMLLCYAMLNCSFHSFLRASLLFVLTRAYSRLRGFSHYPDLISAVILILLIANPLFITSAWFVISIGTGVCIYLFYRPVSAMIQKKFPHTSKNMISAISVWIVGTVGAIPFSAYFYNGAPMYSIILSLFYVPLSLALLITAPFALVLYEIFGNAWLIGLLCKGILSAMKNLPEMVALLPGCYLALAKPGVLAIAIMVCIAFLLKLYMEGRQSEVKCKAAAAVCIALFSVHVAARFMDVGNMYAYFVNVGQGDGAVIDVRGKDTILIDGGGKSGINNYNYGEEKYLPYLAANGFYRIDLAIVSHCHSDHADGIIAAVEGLDVNTVMLPDVPMESKIKQQLEEAAQSRGTEILYVSKGDRLDFKSGMSIDVLSPEKNKKYDDENDTSLALRICYNDAVMFFGGDMSKGIEQDLAGQIGKADLLKVSHHGSKNSSGEEFVKEVSPEYAVFSVGENNMFGHPNINVQRRFFNSGAKILRTDMMGDIIIKFDKRGESSVSIFKEAEQWQ